MNGLSDDDYNFLVAESMAFIVKIPFFVRPFVPSLRSIIEKIPARLHKYTVKELLDAFDRAERTGALPRRL